MFSGIVTAVGTIRANRSVKGSRDLTIAAPFRGLALGESIAVHGACLTVTAKGRGWFRVQVVPSTLERTRFGELRTGDRVNLERALRVGDRLGGHLVQGHVDGVGVVATVRPSEGLRLVDLRLPDPVARITVPLGSLTVDGVSLTVNAEVGEGTFQVSLIPYTLAHTTLGALVEGDRVHLEGDVIGKYLQTLLETRSRGRAS
jgi:riboflavin synthase